MENIKQFQNKLFDREEITFTLSKEVTPTKQEITKMVSEKFNKPEENIIVEHIYGKFGSNVFEVSVIIYDNLESRMKYEIISKKEKKKRADAEKKRLEEEKKAKEEEEKKKLEEENKENTEDSNVEVKE